MENKGEERREERRAVRMEREKRNDLVCLKCQHIGKIFNIPASTSLLFGLFLQADQPFIRTPINQLIFNLILVRLMNHLSHNQLFHSLFPPVGIANNLENYQWINKDDKLGDGISEKYCAIN